MLLSVQRLTFVYKTNDLHEKLNPKKCFNFFSPVRNDDHPFYHCMSTKVKSSRASLAINLMTYSKYIALTLKGLGGSF